MNRNYFAVFLLILFILLGIVAGAYVRWSTSTVSAIQTRLFSSVSQTAMSGIPPFLKDRKANADESATLLFAGDIMLSRAVGDVIQKTNDPTFPFLRIKEYLDSADLRFANLEGPISDRGVNQGSIYSFRSDPQVVQGLMYAGFNVLSVANNHIMDWGRDALLDTLSILHESNITTVG